uniref:Uncharacterized protein n=1 Tax=Anguilla anguilla TaxID=7936 RepID=A0A0E9VB41_ANGAN
MRNHCTGSELYRKKLLLRVMHYNS